MRNLFLFSFLSVLNISAFAQVNFTENKKKFDSVFSITKTEISNNNIEEDEFYELKHKSLAWYKAMSRPNANYFTVKKSFDKYFGNHKWEKSKAREIGESWIKSNIFYLDKNGKVQPEPAFDDSRYTNHKTNAPAQITATTRNVGSWAMLGPFNSANTAYSGKGNHGGYVYLNRFDPTNTQKIFAAFVTGGLWMTTDGGTNWTLTDSNMPDDTYYDIDVAISNPLIVYAMTETRVIKSTDGGLTWVSTTLIAPTYTGKAYDIAVSPADANIVVARWGNKIYRTINGGTTWTAIVTGLPDYSIWDCSIHSEMLDWSTTNNNVVYCLSTSNNNQVVVLRSVDAGATFAIMTTITLDAAATGQIVGWAKLLLPSTNATEIYVAIGSGATAYNHQAVQLYKLNNTNGAEILKRVNMIPSIGTDALHHGDIAMDKLDENKIVYGTYGQNRLHYSTDNGVTFTYSAVTMHSDLRSVEMINNTVIIGSDGETTLSTDGGINYATITNSISNHELWGFGAAFKTNIVAVGTNHGPVMINEPGFGYEWYNGTGADQGNTDVNPLDDRYIYSQGYSNYRYFRTGVHTLVNESNSLDAGGIYAYFNNLEFHPNLYYSLITHHAGQYPTGNANLATWKNSLIRTNDNGATISIVKTFTNQLFREKICMTNPNYIYVVVGLTNNAVWKTTDAGVTWANITPSSAASSGQTNISDIAVSDVDPNQVWITYSGVQATCKVLKTANAGISWSNLTQPILSTSPNTKIIFQRGSDGGVYIGNKTGIYYKNNTMPNWVLLGNGLPAMEIRNMFINYNLGKLRIGTSRGGWEHDLYETSPPKAQISANTNKLTCARDAIQFKDYSTVRNASATWAWSFPGGTPSSSTLENPTVSYAGSSVGFYDVSLTLTDAFGTSSQTLTNFIEIVSNECNVDTIAGKALSLSSNGDFAQQSTAINITTNTITLSAWIKPNGIQSSFAGIIFSGSGGASGLDFRDNNQLGYHWNDASTSYNWAGGPIVPIDVWSHVALVITPTAATVYLNGLPYTKTTAHPSVNFNSIFQFGIDRGNTSRNFKGLMDEVCIYNRALSTNEIKELMNLTRNNPNVGSLPVTDVSLISYYQFNEGAGKPAYDKVGTNYVSLAGAADKSVTSTAPVGGGNFQRINVTNGGLKNFATPGVELTFPASGTYPNGDVVVTRINLPPDQLPTAFILPSSPVSYYVIRNYGTNNTFSALTSMKIKNVSGITSAMETTASNLKLYKRLSNDDGNTWGSSIDDADVVTKVNGIGTVEFSTGLNNTSFSQFSIGSTSAPLPVQVINFSVKKNDHNEVLLDWEVTQEINLSQYEIERSNDGINFKKCFVIQAKNNSHYNFIDYTPMQGKNYYRLKMVDIDGKFAYSGVKSVNINFNTTCTIWPNPSKDGKIVLIFKGLKSKTDLSISISNLAGQLIKTHYLNAIGNDSQYSFSLDVSGIYFLRITLSDGQLFTKKIVVGK
jgi:photosystem II stability/assembly factor-like uncharacterized protein